jgi:hypothetical protein
VIDNTQNLKNKKHFSYLGQAQAARDPSHLA